MVSLSGVHCIFLHTYRQTQFDYRAVADATLFSRNLKKEKLIWRKKCIFDVNVTFSRLSRQFFDIFLLSFLLSIFLSFVVMLLRLFLSLIRRCCTCYNGDGWKRCCKFSIGTEQSLFVEANVNQLHLNRSKLDVEHKISGGKKGENTQKTHFFFLLFFCTRSFSLS